MTTLDVVLPCYNPRPGWEIRMAEGLTRVRNALPQVAVRWIVVDDGSTVPLTEATLGGLRRVAPDGILISYPRNRGKGYAIRRGMAAASAEFCIFTDADLPYEEDSLLRVFQSLSEYGNDLVVGVRGPNYYAQAPMFRRELSRAFRWLIRRSLRIPIADTQGGLKGFRAKGRSVLLRTKTDGYLCDLECVLLAAREPELAMVPVEVQLKRDVVFSRMNGRTLVRESLHFIAILLSQWP